MKKTIMRFVLALTLILSMVLASGVPAQYEGLTFNSGIRVMNLSASNTANITVYYYAKSSGSLVATVTDTIGVGGVKTYYPPIDSDLDGSFDGSIIVTSNRKIAAMAYSHEVDFSYYMGTKAIESGSATTYLPLVECNNNGFNTFFNVQNMSVSSANITIYYYPAGAGTSGVTETATIAAGAAKTFDQKTGSSTKNCDDLADGSGKFVGSAKITSNQPMGATVMQLKSTAENHYLMSNNGFGSGSDTVELPLIMANNGGYYTGVQIQNIGTITTTVTLDYSTNKGAGGEPDSEVFDLGSGKARTIIQSGAPPGNGSANNWDTIGNYVGAGTVTNSEDINLVAVVNQVKPYASGKGPYATTYEGFDPGDGTSKIAIPLLLHSNDFWSGYQIQNVGGSSCSSITVEYTANEGSGNEPIDETIGSLAAGAPVTILTDVTASDNDWDDDVGDYIGAALITGSNCSLEAIVNIINTTVSNGDTFMTYTGYNY